MFCLIFLEQTQPKNRSILHRNYSNRTPRRRRTNKATWLVSWQKFFTFVAYFRIYIYTFFFIFYCTTLSFLGANAHSIHFPRGEQK